MVSLFNRKAFLTVGEFGQLGDKFEGFRIKFSISMDDDIKANKASIQIFNISALKAGLIQDIPKPYVRLEVGYGNDIEVLYDGDVEKTKYEKVGTETVLTLEAGEGTAAAGVRSNKSYNKGSLVKDILQDMVDDIVEGGRLIASSALEKIAEISGIKIKSGEVVKGRTIDKLKLKLAKYGYKPTINQNRQLTFVKEGDPEFFEAVLINQNTGLIGIPIKTEKGFQFRSKIQPGIVRPLTKVQIDSDVLLGTGTVKKCQYNGDTHGPEWQFEAEATWFQQ